MIRTMYALPTAGMAAAARPCAWRDRGVVHVQGASTEGGLYVMPISNLQVSTFATAPNATKRSPRRLGQRLT